MSRPQPLACVCGHKHGYRPCADCAKAGKTCARFRRAQWVATLDHLRRPMMARVIAKDGGTAFYAPDYHLRAYGLQSPWVRECIRLGLYFDIEEAPISPAVDALDGASLAIAKQMRLL